MSERELQQQFEALRAEVEVLRALLLELSRRPQPIVYQPYPVYPTYPSYPSYPTITC